MNGTGDDEDSDDGLVLAGEGNTGMAFNQMMLADPNLDLNFQQMGISPEQMMKPPMLTGWIQWFISLEDHDFLLEIDVDFINDKMNLLKLREEYQSTQLQQKNMEDDRYRECLRLIKSSKVPNEEDLQN